MCIISYGMNVDTQHHALLTFFFSEDSILRFKKQPLVIKDFLCPETHHQLQKTSKRRLSASIHIANGEGKVGSLCAIRFYTF